MSLLRLALIIVLGFLAAPLPAAEQLDGAGIIARIIEHGDAASDAYDETAPLAAASTFSALYFEHFEALEFDLGVRDNALKKELEGLFGTLNGDAMRGVPRPRLENTWRELKEKLTEAQALYGTETQASGSGAFFKALIILLREGVEAMLVVGALAAYLRRAGAADKTWVIYAGVVLAVIASLATGFAIDRLLQDTGAPLAVVEGLTLLAASAMLFLVSCWLFAKRSAKRWEEWIAQQMESALGKGSLFALGGTACFAVYREGAETVLFYEALATAAPGQGGEIAAGFAFATVLLALGYFLMRQAALRMPFGLFFGATSALLYGLSVVFLGQAIIELETAGWIARLTLPGIPQVSWLGLAPSAQSLGAQAALILLPLIWFAAARFSSTAKKEAP